MKKVLLSFSLIGIYAAASAQQDHFDISKYLQKKVVAQKNLLLPGTGFKIQPMNPASISIGEQLYTLPNGDKVAYGVGRMPCVKTDMRQFMVMPNVSTPGHYDFMALQNMAGKIPNGVTPFISSSPYFDFQHVNTGITF